MADTSNEELGSLANDDTPKAASGGPNILMRHAGVTGIATGAACLLVCELPVLLAMIGLGGLGAWFAYLQPSPIIEAGASVLIFAGAILYLVWRRRASRTRV